MRHRPLMKLLVEHFLELLNNKYQQKSVLHPMTHEYNVAQVFTLLANLPKILSHPERPP